MYSMSNPKYNLLCIIVYNRQIAGPKPSLCDCMVAAQPDLPPARWRPPEERARAAWVMKPGSETCAVCARYPSSGDLTEWVCRGHDAAPLKAVLALV